MSYEVRLNKRIAQVDLLSQEGSLAKISIDGMEYEADIIMVEQGVYSILLNGRSFNVELFPGERPKTYTINTKRDAFDAEIIDAEARYRMNTSTSISTDSDKILVSPMPGKVVKVLVAVGDEVVIGQPLIVVSAMKMDSEFRSKVDGIVSEVRVNEGDTVEGRQIMVIID
ncbi:MAG TPA: biotin/lipoyl-containing protein [Williamwhitmania sp.]|nr:biotin/lipoyl-containing protein [Williamwhitmania sp.]